MRGPSASSGAAHRWTPRSGRLRLLRSPDWKLTSRLIRRRVSSQGIVRPRLAAASRAPWRCRAGALSEGAAVEENADAAVTEEDTGLWGAGGDGGGDGGGTGEVDEEGRVRYSIPLGCDAEMEAVRNSVRICPIPSAIQATLAAVCEVSEGCRGAAWAVALSNLMPRLLAGVPDDAHAAALLPEVQALLEAAAQDVELLEPSGVGNVLRLSALADQLRSPCLDVVVAVLNRVFAHSGALLMDLHRMPTMNVLQSVMHLAPATLQQLPADLPDALQAKVAARMDAADFSVHELVIGMMAMKTACRGGLQQPLMQAVVQQLQRRLPEMHMSDLGVALRLLRQLPLPKGTARGAFQLQGAPVVERVELLLQEADPRLKPRQVVAVVREMSSGYVSMDGVALGDVVLYTTHRLRDLDVPEASSLLRAYLEHQQVDPEAVHRLLEYLLDHVSQDGDVLLCMRAACALQHHTHDSDERYSVLLDLLQEQSLGQLLTVQEMVWLERFCTALHWWSHASAQALLQCQVELVERSAGSEHPPSAETCCRALYATFLAGKPCPEVYRKTLGNARGLERLPAWALVALPRALDHHGLHTAPLLGRLQGALTLKQRALTPDQLQLLIRNLGSCKATAHHTSRRLANQLAKQLYAHRRAACAGEFTMQQVAAVLEQLSRLHSLSAAEKGVRYWLDEAVALQPELDFLSAPTLLRALGAFRVQYDSADDRLRALVRACTQQMRCPEVELPELVQAAWALARIDFRDEGFLDTITARTAAALAQQLSSAGGREGHGAVPPSPSSAASSSAASSSSAPAAAAHAAPVSPPDGEAAGLQGARQGPPAELNALLLSQLLYALARLRLYGSKGSLPKKTRSRAASSLASAAAGEAAAAETSASEHAAEAARRVPELAAGNTAAHADEAEPLSDAPGEEEDALADAQTRREERQAQRREMVELLLQALRASALPGGGEAQLDRGRRAEKADWQGRDAGDGWVEVTCRSGRTLSNVLWSLGQLEHKPQDPGFLPWMEAQLCEASRPRSLSCIGANGGGQLQQQVVLASQSIANTFTGFLHLGHLPSAELVQALLAARSPEEYESRELVCVLYYLARNREKLDTELPARWRENVPRVFVARQKRWDNEGLCSMVWAMSQLGMELDADAAKHAVKHVIKFRRKLSPSHISSFVFAMRKMKVDIDLRMELLLSPNGASLDDLARIEPKELSMMAWAYSGSKFEDTTALHRIMTVLQPNLKQLPVSSICSTMWALSRANYFDVQTGKRMLAILKRRLADMSAVDHANVLYGIARYEARWSWADRVAFGRKALPFLRQLSEQGFALSSSMLLELVWALGYLKLYNEAVLDALSRRFQEVLAAGELDEEGCFPSMVTLMCSLARLGHEDKQLVDTLRTALAKPEHARKIPPLWTSLSSCLWSFASLGMHPGAPLLQAVHATLLANPQLRCDAESIDYVTRMLWSLAVLDEVRHPLARTLAQLMAKCERFPSGTRTLARQQLSQFLLAASASGDREVARMLQAMPQALRLEASRAWKDTLMHEGKVSTGPLRQISRTLAALGVQHRIHGMVANNCLTADILIPASSRGRARGKGEGRVGLALEVFPSYALTQNTRRPMGKRMLRSRMLAAAGCRVVPIEATEWKAMAGDPQLQETYLEGKLLAAGGVP